MDEFDVIAWQHLTDDIRYLADCKGAGFWDAIQRAIAYKNHLDREADMAKPKPPVPKGGADDGKFGKHHGGNMHGNAKTGSTGKHAAPPKGGGKK